MKYDLKQGIIVFTIGSVLILYGCIAPMSYQVAVPQLPSENISGKVHQDIIEINLPELTLFAQVQAFDWGGQYLLPPLGVWINIESKNGPLMIKTMGVTLKSDADEPLTPVSYLGPGTKWFSPRAFAAGCGPRIYRTGIGISRMGVSQESVMSANNNVGIYRPSENAISVDSENCFMFWFDTDSMPDHTYILSIAGILKDGREVLIPNLRFSKGTVTTIRGFP